MNQTYKSMEKSIEIPSCNYPNEAILITPSSQTPNHILYLSNLDDQPLLRNAVRYLYLFKKSTSVEALKLSLSKILVHYYPLAGRVRSNKDDKIEVDCNGKGALFAEGFLNLSADDFLKGSRWPNKSWIKLLHPHEHWDFFDFPPLTIHVIHLNCGGMILLATLNHALRDGIGSSQFLNAWAEITRNRNTNLSIIPFHSRHLLKPRTPPHPTITHPEFSLPSFNLTESNLSQPLVPVSVTFTSSQIQYLKKQWVPLFKCTSFEVLTSHLWRTFVKTMDLPASFNAKLIFTINARKKLSPNLPDGYYGNGIVYTCAESMVDKLITSHPRYGVELVQKAKEKVNDEYVRSVVDLLEVKKVEVDLCASLIVTQWSKIGLEDVDFGNGKPVHMGPLASYFCCFLLPVIGDIHAYTMLISVPERVAEKFEFFLKDVGEENGLIKENS